MMEEAIRKAHFWMPPKWGELQKSDHAARMVSKFMEGEEAEGWAAMARPVVLRPRVISAEMASFWTPTQMEQAFTITEEHPWYDPERDLYLIQYPARRKAVGATLELPDEFIQEQIDKHGLSPDGEFLPGWKV